MRLIRPCLDGGHGTWPSPLCGVVLSVLHGAGMVSDRTEVTAVPSVLAGPVQRAHSYQSRHARQGLTSPHSSQGLGRWRGHEFLERHEAKSDEGLMADFGLSAWPSFLGLAGHRSVGPLLANVSWDARAAN